MVFYGNRTLRIVALLVGLAPLLLSCVKQADGTQAPLPEEKRQPISVSLRSSYRTKGTTPTEDEQRIVSLDVFVFRGNALEAHGRSSGLTVADLVVTHGTKTVWVFCNFSEGRMDGIRSLSDAVAFAPLFSENNTTAFCMRGTRSITVSEASTNFEVDVKRDVAKVTIGSAPTFTNKAAGGTLQGVYLINVPKIYDEDTILSSSSASSVWNFNNSVESGADAAVASLTSASGSNSGCSAFYGFPNASPESAPDADDAPSDIDYVTKCVLKCSIGGNTYWYAVGIPGMQSNKEYIINNIVISRKGASHPNEYVQILEDIEFELSVSEWNDVNKGNIELHTPLTFEITSSGTITWKCTTSSNPKTIQFRKNGGEWTDITSTTAGASIPVVIGDILEFKGNNLTYSSRTSYNTFGGTAKFYAYGDVLSLMNYRKILTSYDTDDRCMSQLFAGSLIDVSPEKDLVLTATNLCDYSYASMFKNCTRLTRAPILPAMNLGKSCYSQMFYGCTSLVVAPELPATSLINSCYYGMFQGCTSLCHAPELIAKNLATQCYYAMFNNCSNIDYIYCLATSISGDRCTNWLYGVKSTGTFVKSSELVSWTTGVSGIPSGWTVVDD